MKTMIIDLGKFTIHEVKHYTHGADLLLVEDREKTSDSRWNVYRLWKGHATSLFMNWWESSARKHWADSCLNEDKIARGYKETP